MNLPQIVAAQTPVPCAIPPGLREDSPRAKLEDNHNPTAIDDPSELDPMMTFMHPHLGAFFPGMESLFSTQGIMVLLLVAYAGAMWMFLTSAPKVYTIMVSDLDTAREFYEGLLNLAAADVPLHYYYNYEQSLTAASIDPLYGMSGVSTLGATNLDHTTGLWYQLKKNTQLHVIVGAQYGDRARERHVCFDRDCLETILLRVQSRQVRFKLRSRRPVNFLAKDVNDRVIEFAEVATS